MYDTPARVWHCNNRISDRCSKHYTCKGTICSDYYPNVGAVAIDKNFIRKRKEDGHTGKSA
jgi:hypothetical protein